MEVPESNSSFHIEDHHSPPSLGESEEDYLRTTWGKLGVGQDGYLDQSQLAVVCECIGMDKLSDEVSFFCVLSFLFSIVYQSSLFSPCNAGYCTAL